MAPEIIKRYEVDTASRNNKTIKKSIRPDHVLMRDTKLKDTMSAKLARTSVFTASSRRVDAQDERMSPKPRDVYVYFNAQSKSAILLKI